MQDAFRRALAYNLDARVKVMEEALAQNDLDLSRYDLLPKLYTNDIYTSRNNQNASSSQSVINGTQTVPPSRSTDIDDLSAQLTLSWNILDFGVSYVNARQQANRVLVAEEERRKVVTNLLGDVRRAYWRAAAAQRLHGRIEEAIHEAQNALAGRPQGRDRRLAVAGRFAALPESAARPDRPARGEWITCSTSPRWSWRR